MLDTIVNIISVMAAIGALLYVVSCYHHLQYLKSRYKEVRTLYNNLCIKVADADRELELIRRDCNTFLETSADTKNEIQLLKQISTRIFDNAVEESVKKGKDTDE